MQAQGRQGQEPCKVIHIFVPVFYLFLSSSFNSIVIDAYNYNCASSVGSGAGVGSLAENVNTKVIANENGKDDEDEK